MQQTGSTGGRWLDDSDSTAVSPSDISDCWDCRVVALSFLRIRQRAKCCHQTDWARLPRTVTVAAVWNVQSVIVRKWCRRFGFNAPWRSPCFCHRQKKPRATSTSPTSWSTEPSSARKNSELTFGISRVNVFNDSVGRRVQFECMLIFFSSVSTSPCAVRSKPATYTSWCFILLLRATRTWTCKLPRSANFVHFADFQISLLAKRRCC